MLKIFRWIYFSVITLLLICNYSNILTLESSLADVQVPVSRQTILPTNIIPHSDGLASCLLIKDDNSRLQKWLVYHWMQGMQYLIVARDPARKTSPEEILEAMSDMTGMEIIIWDDPHYRYEIPKKKSPLTIHKSRQQSLLAECLRHHKTKGHSWVFHTDPDEYITNNVVFGAGQNTILRQDQDLWQYLTNKTAETPYTVDDMRDNVCIHVPRLTFSGKEDEKNLSHSAKSNVIDPRRFDTLKFPYHANPKKKNNNKLGKFLLNLEYVPFGIINRGDLFSIHRPFTQFCGPAYQYNERFPFMINHYIGSWEQYSNKEDSRRNRETYDVKASKVHNRTHHIQGWVDGFLSVIGISNGIALLNQVDNLELNHPNEKALYKLAVYPGSRGSGESYQTDEFNLNVVQYFEANGDLTDFQKIMDESHFTQDKRFNHKTTFVVHQLTKFLDSTCALILFWIRKEVQREVISYH